MSIAHRRSNEVTNLQPKSRHSASFISPQFASPKAKPHDKRKTYTGFSRPEIESRTLHSTIIFMATTNHKLTVQRPHTSYIWNTSDIGRMHVCTYVQTAKAISMQATIVRFLIEWWIWPKWITIGLFNYAKWLKTKGERGKRINKRFYFNRLLFCGSRLGVSYALCYKNAYCTIAA